MLVNASKELDTSLDPQSEATPITSEVDAIISSVETKRVHGCTYIVNDPSAGSPTETLLRLFLPLNDQV